MVGVESTTTDVARLLRKLSQEHVSGVILDLRRNGGGSLEEAISLSDSVYLLSQGPRARITRHYTVSIPRPRDPVRARVHPAFAPLYEKLWADLSREVERDHTAEAA